MSSRSTFTSLVSHEVYYSLDNIDEITEQYQQEGCPFTFTILQRDGSEEEKHETHENKVGEIIPSEWSNIRSKHTLQLQYCFPLEITQNE